MFSDNFWAEALSQTRPDFINNFRLHKTAIFENLLWNRNKTKHYPIHKLFEKDWESGVLRDPEQQTYFSYLNTNLEIQIYAWMHENPEHNLLKF